MTVKTTAEQLPRTETLSKPIRVGVVGCGYWGPNLIRNFRALPDCQLKCVCDLSDARLKHMKGMYPEVNTTKDFGHLLNGEEVDAVVVATSVGSHYRMASAALRAGKHTFIEKPMGTSSRECQELIDLAQARNLTLMIGHTFLYSSPIRAIKEIVRSGGIGEVRYICSRRLNLGLYQKDINVTWDLAPHDISIILHIVEEMPVAVSCQGQAHVTPGVEDVTVLCLHFKNNRLAIIHTSWLEPRKVREMTIVGSHRMIVYDDVASLEKVKIYDARVERPPHYETFGEFDYAYHYGDIHSPYVKQEEPLNVECQHFLASSGRGRPPLSGGAEGLALVRILEAASLSLKRQGVAVPLEPMPTT